MKFKMTIARRKQIYGILFCLPFIIGFILFFLSPLTFFVNLAFSRMTMWASSDAQGIKVGGMDGIKLEWIGIENFQTIFIKNADWVQGVWTNLRNLAYRVPSTVLFSFFVAIILNQKFKGRFVARAVFFLPVIVASGALSILSTDQLTQAAYSVVRGTSEVTSDVSINSFYRTIVSLFGQNDVSRMLVTTVDTIISSMDGIVNSSGVQILIFLAGLQTIPVSLYEASHMDGASSWENFWKITLPMLSPILLVNTAYTIVDSLAASDNWAVTSIYRKAMWEGNYAMSAAMGVFYYTVVLSVIGLLLYFMSKLVYYEDR